MVSQPFVSGTPSAFLLACFSASSSLYDLAYFALLRCFSFFCFSPFEERLRVSLLASQTDAIVIPQFSPKTFYSSLEIQQLDQIQL